MGHRIAEALHCEVVRRCAVAAPRSATRRGRRISGSPDPGGWRECRDASGDGTNRGAAGSADAAGTGFRGLWGPGSWRSRAVRYDNIQPVLRLDGVNVTSVEFGINLIRGHRRCGDGCCTARTAVLRPGFAMTPGRCPSRWRHLDLGCGGSRWRPVCAGFRARPWGVVEAVPFARPSDVTRTRDFDDDRHGWRPGWTRRRSPGWCGCRGGRWGGCERVVAEPPTGLSRRAVPHRGRRDLVAKASRYPALVVDRPKEGDLGSEGQRREDAQAGFFDELGPVRSCRDQSGLVGSGPAFLRRCTAEGHAPRRSCAPSFVREARR